MYRYGKLLSVVVCVGLMASVASAQKWGKKPFPSPSPLSKGPVEAGMIGTVTPLEMLVLTRDVHHPAFRQAVFDAKGFKFLPEGPKSEITRKWRRLVSIGRADAGKRVAAVVRLGWIDNAKARATVARLIAKTACDRVNQRRSQKLFKQIKAVQDMETDLRKRIAVAGEELRRLDAGRQAARMPDAVLSELVLDQINKRARADVFTGLHAQLKTLVPGKEVPVELRGLAPALPVAPRTSDEVARVKKICGDLLGKAKVELAIADRRVQLAHTVAKADLVRQSHAAAGRHVSESIRHRRDALRRRLSELDEKLATLRYLRKSDRCEILSLTWPQ